MLLASRPSRFFFFAIGASFCWFIILFYRRYQHSSHLVPQFPPTTLPNNNPSSIAYTPKTPGSQLARPEPVPFKPILPSGPNIEELWRNAKTKHANMLERQSRTIEDARMEYLKRYRIPPPKGYDKWFAYAMEHDSPIIDEFDALMSNLAPFRSYIQNSCQFDHSHDPLPAMLPICIKNGTVDAGNPSPYDTKQIKVPFIDFVSEFVGEVQDMCFYINTFDEPRHVIPREKMDRMKAGTNMSCEVHEVTGFKRTDVWKEVIVPCAETSPARNPEGAGNASVSLVENWNAATDLCSFSSVPPAGMLRCPENLSVTSSSRPVLSAASLSTFSDILFPTLWRWRFDAKQGAAWAKTDDITPWEEKNNLVGWRGSSNGGYAMGDNWRQFQRHRMVRLANGHHLETPYELQSTPNLQNWLNVQFTSIVGCDDATCPIMETEMPTVESQKLSDTFKNKIVLDMDGHGLSGRFYMLLQSDSAVMKQGIVREWHDSRLLPWLHYVPLSMGMSELEGMLEYLFSEGDHVLKDIAMESKKWAATALRREDMRIYMYRLLIELGRRTFD